MVCTGTTLLLHSCDDLGNARTILRRVASIPVYPVCAATSSTSISEVTSAPEYAIHAQNTRYVPVPHSTPSPTYDLRMIWYYLITT